jgi:hypothetical protein
VDYYNDYREVDVPKPGHPNHVPVAIPLDGTYDHWVSVRGVHTDHDAWNYTGPLTVHGFWINDPIPDGIGNDTYITVDRLTSEYYYQLDLLGEWYHNKFVTVTDPPNLDVETPKYTGAEITFSHTIEQFSAFDKAAIRHRSIGSFFTIFADKAVEHAARANYENIKMLDNRLPELGELLDISYNDDECRVYFENSIEIFIDTFTGGLLEIRLS